VVQRRAVVVNLLEGICASGAVLAFWAAIDLGRYLLALSSSKLVNPPHTGALIALLVVLGAVAMALAVVSWQIWHPTSGQQELIAGWSVGGTILWVGMLGYVLLVNYPVPAMAHHTDKFLFGSILVLAWAMCLAIRPDILKRGVDSRLYDWLKLGLVNVVVFALIGETALRLADPVLARSGLFGDKHTPANLIPHRAVDGSIGRTNSQGFRDRERVLERTTSTPRAIALGDSFTWGAGVSYDEVFVTLLERALQESTPGSEIINLGVPAWGPHEERHLLEAYGIRFAPDLVLLNFYVGNDIQNKRGNDLHMPEILVVAGQSYYVHSNGNQVHDGLGPERWYLYHHLHYLFRIGTARYLNAAERQERNDGIPLASSALYLKGIYERSDIYLKEDTPFFAHHWDRTQATLLAMRDFLEARGIRLFLVVIPDHIQLDHEVQTKYMTAFSQSSGRYDFEKPQRLLRAWCSSHGVMMLDLLPTFKRYDRAAELYFLNDVHLSASGHALAAQAILPALKAWATDFKKKAA
jgi:lysophospholipase L1-like esterase